MRWSLGHSEAARWLGDLEPNLNRHVLRTMCVDDGKDGENGTGLGGPKRLGYPSAPEGRRLRTFDSGGCMPSATKMTMMPTTLAWWLRQLSAFGESPMHFYASGAPRL